MALTVPRHRPSRARFKIRLICECETKQLILGRRLEEAKDKGGDWMAYAPWVGRPKQTADPRSLLFSMIR